MATLPVPLTLAAGSSRTGLAASVVAAATDAGGTTRSLGTLTWAEETDASGSASTGVYAATAQFDPTWLYPVKVKLTITGQSGFAADTTVRAVDLTPVDGSGYVKAATQTNADKTGYTASTVTDKTGYSLAGTQAFNLTGNVTGSLSGSVGSVTGAVGSVAAAVTAGTVTDKTGYSLTTSEHTAISGTDVPAALTAQGYTTARAGYLDTLNGLVTAIWASATRSLTTFGTLTADAAAAVWGATTRTLSAFGFSVAANNLPGDYQQRGVAVTLPALPNVTVGGYAAGQDPATLTWGATTRTLTAFPFTPNSGNPGLTSAQQTELDAIKAKTDNLPADPASNTQVSTRLAASGYTAPANPTDYARSNVAPSWWVSPDNADVATALSDLVSLLGRTDPTTALSTLQTAATAIRAKTDQLTFTGGSVNAAALSLPSPAPSGYGSSGSVAVYGDAGAVAYTYTVYDVGGTTPLPGAAVYVSADSAGTQRSQTRVSDSLGRVTFQLDAGTVYFWRSHPARTFVNPHSEVVS